LVTAAIPELPCTYSAAMVATTLFAIDVVPLVATTGFFAVKPFGGYAPINQEPREISSDPGSKTIWPTRVLGHWHTLLVKHNVWLRGGL